MHSHVGTAPATVDEQILYTIKLRLLRLPSASVQSLQSSVLWFLTCSGPGILTRALLIGCWISKYLDGGEVGVFPDPSFGSVPIRNVYSCFTSALERLGFLYPTNGLACPFYCPTDVSLIYLRLIDALLRFSLEDGLLSLCPCENWAATLLGVTIGVHLWLF